MGLTDMTIYDCLESRAVKTPEAVFLKHGEEVYTWECVNNITSKLVYILADQGISKGDRVGIYGANSASWIIAFMALQKMGAVAVLINSCYREKELEDCIEMSNIKYFFYLSSDENSSEYKTVNRLRKSIKVKNVKFYNIEKTYDQWEKTIQRELKTRHKELEKPNCDDLSCILFTSGTTNNCKGVMLTHKSIVNNAIEVSKHMRWNESDNLCLVVPLFHCFGVTVSLVASVVSGMKITLISKYKTVNVCRAIEENRCTVLNGVPSMFLAMIKNPRFKEFDLSSLKSGIIAGSPIYRNEYLDICRHLSPMKLQTSYGLTEASPCVTITDYEDDLALKSISAGKVIKNVEVKIVDVDTKKTCPTGKCGEIYVKGYNVTKGYLSNDPVVCDAVQKDGWLRTGDLGYLDENGYLYIVGRRKNLIIRGGENISPYEIEKYIKDVKQGLEVYVFGIYSSVLQEEIVACIEGNDNPELEQSIVEYLNNNIAKYKMPKFFVFIEKFPKNPTGKFNEKKLKELVSEKLGGKIEESHVRKTCNR